MKLSLVPLAALIAGCSINVASPDVSFDAGALKLPSVSIPDAAPCPDATVVIVQDAGVDAPPEDACRASISCYCNGAYISVEKFDSKTCDLKTAYALCLYLQLRGEYPVCP